MTALIEFNDDDLPSAVHAERYRDVDGKQVLTPWSGYTRDWKHVAERLFPMKWESVWHLPEGDLTAVRIEILELRTERATRATAAHAHVQAIHPQTALVTGE